MSPVVTSLSRRPSGPLPSVTGIGLRAPHYRRILEDRPALGWLEVHSENYFGNGGVPAYFLERFRNQYPLSLHGVGLSLGSTDPLDRGHLEQLRELISAYEPALVSEHLSWGSVGGRYLNDLLPLPYTEEALDHLVSRVQQVQESLGRQILVENISCYLQYGHSTIPEHEFLSSLAARSGCGILLDINNVYVNARNHGLDAEQYLRAMPPALVQEIHLAGHTVNTIEDATGRQEILIDTHNQRVCDDVWALYTLALGLMGAKPTLIEWDTDLPDLDVLLDEKRHADQLQESRHVRVA